MHSPTGSDRKKVGTKVGTKASPVKKSKLKSSPTDPKKRKAVLKPRDAVESDADGSAAASGGDDSPPEPKVTKRKGKKLRKEALKPKMQDDFFGKFEDVVSFYFVVCFFLCVVCVVFLLLELNLVGVVLLF